MWKHVSLAQTVWLSADVMHHLVHRDDAARQDKQRIRSGGASASMVYPP